MYYEHFSLSGEPFSLTPDPAFLFLGAKHREAMAAVEYGLVHGRGFITLIGEVGTGKTTILYGVLSRLGPEMATAYIPYAAHGFEDLLRVALKDLGERPTPDASRLDLLEMLQGMLLRRDAAGQRTALVIDEAQSLPDATFEELRLLSNFETYTHKLLQIVLVGQPELQDRLRQQNLRQLRERVSVRAVINPLGADEMRDYIGHRLAQVGGDSRLFQPGALRAIVRHARGIPRRANILCHNALLFAYGRGLPQVTSGVAAEAIAEMEERKPGWGGRALVLRRRAWWRPVSWAVAGIGSLAVVGAFMARGRSAGPEIVMTDTVTAPPAQEIDLASRHEPPPSDAATATQETRVDAVPVAVQRIAAVPIGPAGDADSLATRKVSLDPGESILSAAREAYGRPLSDGEERALLAQIRRLNPGLRNVNVVRAGATVNLPAVPVGSSSRIRGPE
jgi:general secretion pathway protein A